jgi:hypothetical protein
MYSFKVYWYHVALIIPAPRKSSVNIQDRRQQSHFILMWINHSLDRLMLYHYNYPQMGLKKGPCALLVRCSTTWVIPPRVWLSHFSNRILFMCWLLGPAFSYLHFLRNWNYRNIPPYLAVGWDGFLGTFCLSWPWTTVLPISASWVARIICTDNCVQLWYPFYKDKA